MFYFLLKEKVKLIKTKWAIDLFIVFIIFIIAFSVANKYLERNLRWNPTTIMQESFMIACDKGFSTLTSSALNDLDKLPAWNNFLEGRYDSSICEIIEGKEVTPATDFAKMHLYLYYSLGFTLKVLGPSIRSYYDYLSFFYGITFVLLYILFRLGMGKIIASAFTILLIFSQQFLNNMPYARAFSKATFFLIAILGISIILKQQPKRSSLFFLSSILGLTLGFGLGFRSDILITVPGFLFFIWFFLPTKTSFEYQKKAITSLLFILFFSFSASPLLPLYFSPNKPASNLSHVTLLGLNGYTDTQLGDNLYYDYGIIYDDGNANVTINSYNQRINGSTKFDIYGTREYDEVGKEVLLEYLKNFPADFIARFYAAIIYILQLNPFGLYTTIIALLFLFGYNLRLAISVLFILMFFTGYNVLQFSSRHFFYLEFVSWWFTGFLIQQLIYLFFSIYRKSKQIDIKQMLRECFCIIKQSRMNYIWLGSIFVCFCSVLWCARLYQQFHLKNLFETYYNADIEPLQLVKRDVGNNNVIINGVFFKNNDVINTTLSTTILSEYIVAEFNCSEALSKNFNIKFLYEDLPYWTRNITVDCSLMRGITRIFIPIYYYNYIKFAGIEINKDDFCCLKYLYRVKDLSDFPLLLDLKLPQDWQEKKLYKTIHIDLTKFRNLFSHQFWKYYFKQRFHWII